MKTKLHPDYYFWDESYRETSSRNPNKDKRKPKAHKPFKKISQAKVNEFLEKFIDSLPVEFRRFSKEKLSRIHLIPQSQIERALTFLNIKGKMSRPVHYVPHDNERERRFGMGWGGFGGWGQDAYTRMESHE